MKRKNKKFTLSTSHQFLFHLSRTRQVVIIEAKNDHNALLLHPKPTLHYLQRNETEQPLMFSASYFFSRFFLFFFVLIIFPGFYIFLSVFFKIFLFKNFHFVLINEFGYNCLNFPLSRKYIYHQHPSIL